MYESETIEVFLEKQEPPIWIVTIHFWHFTSLYKILEMKLLWLCNWQLAVGQIQVYSLDSKMKIHAEKRG
jgi:hypothetical protein